MGNKIINKLDARYIQHDEKIRKVLLSALRSRCLSLKKSEICERAVITRPTLNTHCNNASEALEQYEKDLRLDFRGRLPVASRKKVLVFTIMLSFISDKQEYFRATLPSSDFYLLNDIFKEIRQRIGCSRITNKRYEIYMQRQIALICCWGKYEDFEQGRIPFYVDRMTETEIVDLGLE